MAKILILDATETVGWQVALLLLQGNNSSLAARNTDKVKYQVRCGFPGNAPKGRRRMLRSLGGEYVHFDLNDDATWKNTFRGIERIFVASPPRKHTELDRFANCLKLARSMGVMSVVKLSDITALASVGGERTPRGDWVAQCDEVVTEMGFDHCTLCIPTLYMDDLLAETDPMARTATSREGAVAYVSSADVAAVSVEALSYPDVHDDERYIITGSVALSNEQVSHALSIDLGEHAGFTYLTEEEYNSVGKAHDISADHAEDLLATESFKRRGELAYVSPDVYDVLGRPAETFQYFLSRRSDRKIQEQQDADSADSMSGSSRLHLVGAGVPSKLRRSLDNFKARHVSNSNRTLLDGGLKRVHSLPTPSMIPRLKLTAAISR